MRGYLSIAAALALAAVPGAALAQDGGTSITINADFAAVGEVLIIFLVLSVVFEVALTPIFNWRIFIRYLEGKGAKTIITVALAFIVFWSYELDIVKDLLNALGQKDESGQQIARTTGGQVLTALLIAGGSNGVYSIFKRLNIRDVEERNARVRDEAQRRTQASHSGAGAGGG